MRIDRIILKHFRSHHHTVISLERINFIRGLNRSGKTGLAMGVEIALSGRCAVTDEGGKGFEQLIEEGQQTATIVLECTIATPDPVKDTAAIITVTLDRGAGRSFKVETDNRAILGRQAQQWIAENIAPPDVMSAALNAWRFVSLSANEQASLLARVLLPAKLELEPEIASWLAANKLAVIERPTLFATIEATYQAIATARTDVNRKLRDLKAIEEPDPIVGDREAIKTKLKQLQDQREATSNMLHQRSEAEATVEKNRAKLPELDSDIQEMETKLNALPKRLSAAARNKLETIERRHPERVAASTALGAARIELMKATDSIAQLSTEAQICPTCKTALTKAARQALLEPHIANQTELQRAIDRIEDQLKEIGDTAEAARLLVADNDNHTMYNDGKYTLEKLQNIRANMISPAPEVLAFGESIETVTTELETLKARITKGLDALVRMVELEERHAIYKRQVEERTQAEKRQVQLQKLLDYFGPTGLKAKLIAERLNLFTERVNAVLDCWGYSLSLFTIEPYVLRIVDQDAASITLSPNQLSSSESYRLGVAFAMAIADWTGVRLLVADAADILDKPDKWKFAQALLHSNLDQAILTSTGIAGTFEAEGTAFYTLSRSEGITATELDALTASTAVAAYGT